MIFVLYLNGCTKTIDNGTYGQFIIGESKTSVLNKILELNIKPSPITFENIYINNPTEGDFETLDNENGILIWFDQDPFPLRIILSENAVLKTWGSSGVCRASKEKMNVACNEIKRLGNLIHSGIARDALYKLLNGFDSSLSMQLGNFVVGYQSFRVNKNAPQKEYQALLLSNNAWSFTGLRDLLWLNHYYSNVKVYFKDEKLIKIEHWRFLVELP